MLKVEDIASSTRPILILDYDGTLAPFVVERNKAFPYPGVIERLERIASETKTRLIIVSGRAIEDLKPLLNLRISVEMWGSHGIERLLPDGTYTREEIGPEACEGLERARVLCEKHLPKDAIEVKPASIAVHVRGRSKDIVEEEILPAFDEIAFAAPLEVHHFDGGIELRPDHVNKGKAISHILSTAGDGLIAYLGDDRTDEEAFEALGERGLKVLVRSEPRKTKADMRLSPPEELLTFLNDWIEYGRI